MKRAWLTFTCSLCFGIVVATAYVLLLATPALAATGSASCPNGAPVTCSAHRCICSDGIGCSAIDSDGGETVTRCSTTPKDDRPSTIAEGSVS